MISTDTFRKLALSFPGTTEQPHFERAAFRTKKRIFATLLESNKTANIKLSEIEQSVYCAIDRSVIYPIPNKWGKQGWITVELGKAKKDIVTEALSSAYHDALPPLKK